MYAREITEASKSALLEIGLVLKRYRTDMVLSGGWAPYFITNGYFEHCGSIDIDLVLRTKIMKKYETIKKSILKLGYIEEDPFRFSRTVKSPIDGKDYGVYLDFLCDKEGMKHVDLKNVQEDLQAFSFEGLNIAFEFNFEQEIAAILPNNGEAKTQFRVIDLVGSLALKGQALDGRAKPKDSYDIYALAHYGGGPEKAAEYFNITVSKKKTPHRNQKTTRALRFGCERTVQERKSNGSFPSGKLQRRQIQKKHRGNQGKPVPKADQDLIALTHTPKFYAVAIQVEH